MKQVFFETFGCQMNVADTDRMELILFHSGYRRTQEKEDADLILVNTCSIREKAEQKTFSLFPQNNNQLSLSFLSDNAVGVYLLKIKIGSEEFVERVVVAD